MPGLEDEFGDIIAKARIGQGCSVSQLASKARMAERDIEAIEAYKLKPDREHVTTLADLLGLDPNKLLEIAQDNWAPPPVRVPPDVLMVESLVVPYAGYGENCYLLACTHTHAAAVVDPGGAVEKIDRRLKELGVTLDLVLITHAHGDHIGGLRQLVRDRPEVRIVNQQLERDSVVRGLGNPWEPVKEGVPIRLGDLAVMPLYTPGHTPGSTCYHVDGVCFVGDTLFAGSIGRPAGPQVFEEMLTRIRGKVLSLPDETALLPGHGPATTVGEEKAHNPFFKV